MPHPDATPNQSATFLELWDALEAASDDEATLGGLRQDVEGADLQDDDRETLRGLIDTYLVDSHLAADPDWEPEMTPDADDAADAEADREDGFAPLERPHT